MCGIFVGKCHFVRMLVLRVRLCKASRIVLMVQNVILRLILQKRYVIFRIVGL
jgi:hypothetical protein